MENNLRTRSIKDRHNLCCISSEPSNLYVAFLYTLHHEIPLHFPNNYKEAKFHYSTW